MNLSRTHRTIALLTAVALSALGLSVATASAATAASSCTATETTLATLNADITGAGSTPITLCLGASITAGIGQNLALGDSSSVTLDLDGNALNITNPGAYNAAIQVPDGASLTIQDSVGGGSITATGGGWSAGIGGGGTDDSAGTISITGGTVTATSGGGGAGIGGGAGGSGGTISITGGTVTATGNLAGISGGAGIGGGVGGSGGTITIAGGTVTATSDVSQVDLSRGAGIGGGSGGSGGTISITGGTVTATGGVNGAGIGGGSDGSGGTISITGGTVTATGGRYGAGIGGGDESSGGTVSIAGGNVTATGGSYGAGIGGGLNGSGGTLQLAGAGVTTTAGKGFGYYSNAARVTVVPGALGVIFTQTGHDATSGSDLAKTTITLTAPPVFDAGSPSSGSYGSPYSFAFSASVPSTQAAATFSAPASNLPPGLSLSSDGVLSGTPTKAGSYPVTVNASSGGLSASQQVTIVIAPAALVVTASSQSIDYGTAPAVVTASYAGLVNGDAGPATPPTCSTAASSTSTVGSYPTSCSGAADSNYSISYSPGSVSVSPAALTVVASSQSTTYGVAPLAVTPSYLGLVNADSAPATPATCATTATVSSKVGTYPTTCTGAADPNYTITYRAGTVTVGRAALIVTASSGTSTYGTAPVPVTASYTGLVNGDTAPATAPVCTTTLTAKSKAGIYPTSCSGASDPDYTISYTAGVDVVGPAALVVVASSQLVSYGTAPAPVTASYVGLAAGDTAPATGPRCSTTASSSSKVGKYATTCSGAVDGDYSITYMPGSVVVNPAPLTITASSQSTTYGTAPAAVRPVYTGLVNNAVAPATAASCSTSATSASKVGVYPTTCTGAADANYTITYTPGTVTVSPAPLTITASSQSVVFGTAPVAVVAKYTGLQLTDKAPATPPVCSTTATAASNVGVYPATCAGAVDADYTITYVPGTVTVTPLAVKLSIAKLSWLQAKIRHAVSITATVTIAATGAPAPGATVTFVATQRSGYQFGCTGVTGANGRVTCVDPKGSDLTSQSICHLPGLIGYVVGGGNYIATSARGIVDY